MSASNSSKRKFSAVIARFNDVRYNDIHGLTTLSPVTDRLPVKNRPIQRHNDIDSTTFGQRHMPLSYRYNENLHRRAAVTGSSQPPPSKQLPPSTWQEHPTGTGRRSSFKGATDYSFQPPIVTVVKWLQLLCLGWKPVLECVQY